MNINDMSEEEQIKAVSFNSYNIRLINDPSERVQLTAIKTNVFNAIPYIENPTKNVIITNILILLYSGNIGSVEYFLNKYSDRNYPEFKIIRKSIENDK